MFISLASSLTPLQMHQTIFVREVLTDTLAPLAGTNALLEDGTIAHLVGVTIVQVRRVAALTNQVGGAVHGHLTCFLGVNSSTLTGIVRSLVRRIGLVHQLLGRDVVDSDYQVVSSRTVEEYKLLAVVQLLQTASTCGSEGATSEDVGSIAGTGQVGVGRVVVAEVDVESHTVAIHLTDVATLLEQRTGVALLLGQDEEVVAADERTVVRNVTHLEDVTAAGAGREVHERVVLQRDVERRCVGQVLVVVGEEGRTWAVVERTVANDGVLVDVRLGAVTVAGEPCVATAVVVVETIVEEFAVLDDYVLEGLDTRALHTDESANHALQRAAAHLERLERNTHTVGVHVDEVVTRTVGGLVEEHC